MLDNYISFHNIEALQMNDNTKLKQLTLRMSKNLHTEFKVSAAKNGQSMGEIAVDLIKRYLKKESDPL